MNKEHFILKEDTEYDSFTETRAKSKCKEASLILEIFYDCCYKLYANCF